jgi:hypothetical protein
MSITIHLSEMVFGFIWQPIYALFKCKMVYCMMMYIFVAMGRYYIDTIENHPIVVLVPYLLFVSN